MRVQVNTDKNIQGDEALAARVEAAVTQSLGHLSAHITRLEVHLSDENGTDKTGGHDKRCMIEARVEGRQPTAVTCEAATVEEAVDGATDRLKSTLTSTLERLHAHR